MSDLVGNPEDMFHYDTAQVEIKSTKSQCSLLPQQHWELLLFTPNSCSVIGPGHITCDSINNDIGSQQLIVCKSSDVNCQVRDVR